MRNYLATLHKRPPHHKKRFALLVSSMFTLLIFAVWVMVQTNDPQLTANDTRQEVSPLGSLLGGVAASWRALSGNFGELKEGLEVIKSESYGR